MTPVRKSARVTAATTVDGTVHRRSNGTPRKLVVGEPYHVKVAPMVMAAAKRAKRPGQRLEVVDESTVRLVNG